MFRSTRAPRALLAVLFVLLLAVPFASAQEGKIRVAVVDFSTEGLSGNSWRFSWSAHNLGRAAADGLTSELVKTGNFRVIERTQLDKVLSEQGLGSSGQLDVSTAARVGKILGVQLIVIGTVTEFSLTERSANIPQIGRWKGLGGVGGSAASGKAAMTARVVDTTTAEILGAYDGKGGHTFLKGEYAGASLGTDWNTGMASMILQEGIRKLAKEIGGAASGLTPSTVRGGLEGKLARVQGGRIFVNIGSGKGLKPGDRFEVRRIGEEITDPDTGESLGGEETVVGTIEIVKIVNDKLSEAKAVEGAEFQAGDRVVMK